jgi:biopolymer transport protein ExbD
VSQIGMLVQTLAKGGPVMVPLFACSIVALAVALELAEGGKLDEALAVAPDLAVVIEADTEVLHGRVVDVMDAVRLAGVGKLAIAVSPREAKR